MFNVTRLKSNCTCYCVACLFQQIVHHGHHFYERNYEKIILITGNALIYHKFPVVYLFPLDISNYIYFYYYFSAFWKSKLLAYVFHNTFNNKTSFTIYPSFTKHKILCIIPLQGKQLFFFFFSVCIQDQEQIRIC